jgi:hypothetical protein
MKDLDQEIIIRLRQMARHEKSVAAMFKELKTQLGDEFHILKVLDYMRAAFCLSLQQVKPIAAFSRNDLRELENEPELEALVMPSIRGHRDQWDR